MTAREATAKRIKDLCTKHNLKVNALANLAGVTPSTLYSILSEKSSNPGIVTIQKLCDGLGISLREFFDCAVFDQVDQEIM